jgi:hypothetical protein
MAEHVDVALRVPVSGLTLGNDFPQMRQVLGLWSESVVGMVELLPGPGRMGGGASVHGTAHRHGGVDLRRFGRHLG